MDIDTQNDSMVGIRGETIIIMRQRRELNKDEALRLAAYLVALADEGNSFPALLEAVRNT